MTILGIDLGTTNSAMAYIKNGQPEMIVNSRGERTTPSVFQKNLSGELVVGSVAKNQYSSLPEQTVLEIKRKMGTDDKVMIGDSSFTPQQISAHFLKYLKQAAEDFLGEKITEAVITVPAYFSDAQRKATKIAGDIAGLKVERILNEPTAAAIAYGLDHPESEKNIIVYDLGGGTFDISVVRLDSQRIEVKASAGNNHLGGMDFDRLLVDWLAEQFAEQYEVALFSFGEESEITQRHARVKLEAENVKKALSSEQEATFNLPFLAVYDGQPLSLDYTITRSEFEDIVRPLLMATLEHVDKAIRDAGLRPMDIDDIILIGGATRIPLVQQLVEEKFERVAKKDINPDEAVALGAAIQGAMKEQSLPEESSLMVIDVCPYTLGTDILRIVDGKRESGYFDILIHRNAPLPVSAKKIYNTVNDNQTTIDIGVYQGDDEDTHVRDDLRITATPIIVDGIPENKAGKEKVEIAFHYDVNGLIQIEATVLSTGRTISHVLDAQRGMMSARQVKEAKLELFDDWEKSKLASDMKAVIRRAKKVRRNAEPQQAVQIDAAIQRLEHAIQEADIELVKEREEALLDMLMDIID
ncbi:Hsp70 family protein [Kurthia huakuii]|uniref:Hsp70 family protein n=1 Tax=Kurthia huakuii TaxID=1421019 RepID=UPI0004964D0C|nr:Hsp70 family protein [Kurthia huakuii]MBM7699229.1 molecular chaperone DnaK [Kurthia huakuii]